MLRQLLTLLAVISGFTLTASPVQAAQASVVSIVQTAERGECVAQGARPMQLVEKSATASQLISPCERIVLVVHIPTVMLRVDRSRE